MYAHCSEFQGSLSGGRIFSQHLFSIIMKNYPLIALVILAFLVSSNVISAQILTLEGGGGYQPTNTTTSFGATLQIPIYAGFGIYGSYVRIVNDDPRRAAWIEDVKRRYPIQSSNDLNFVFPNTGSGGPFWGNTILSAGLTYTFALGNNFSIDIGAGWCSLEGVTITPSVLVVANNTLNYPESPFPFVQTATAFGAVKYKLGSAFSLQGKIAFYGLTHGLGMIGISFHPF